MTVKLQKTLIQKAKAKAKKLERLRKDNRFIRVMGKLVHEALIEAPGIIPSRNKLFLNELLWVGETVEPRVLELLPAILIKRPGIVLDHVYPEDLQETVRALRRRDHQGHFRGIPLEKCAEWIPFVGRKGQLPSVTKTFRLSTEETQLLTKISQRKGISETQVIREAIRILSEQ